MGKNESKRDRQLRRQRARQARAKQQPAVVSPPVADMRFHCKTCGAQFSHPMNIMLGPMVLINEDTGETHELEHQHGRWSAPCPVCHRPADAVNQQTVTLGDITVTGFADTPEQIQAIAAAIEELQHLSADATAEEIASVLEQQGPEMAPVAAYVREHAIELGLFGVGLLTVVVMMLQWLFPRQADDSPPPVPEGITHQQMERLVREVARLSREHDDPRNETDGAHREVEPGSGDSLGAGDKRGDEPRQADAEAEAHK